MQITSTVMMTRIIEEESVSDTEEESPDEDTGEDDQDEMDEE